MGACANEGADERVQRSTDKPVARAAHNEPELSHPSSTATQSTGHDEPKYLAIESDQGYYTTVLDLVADSDAIVVAQVGSSYRAERNGADEAQARASEFKVLQSLLGQIDTDAVLVTYGLNTEVLKGILNDGGGVLLAGPEVSDLAPQTYLLFLERTRFDAFANEGSLYTPVGGSQGVYVVEDNAVRSLTLDELIGSHGLGQWKDQLQVNAPPTVGGFHNDLATTIAKITESDRFVPMGDPALNEDIELTLDIVEGDTQRYAEVTLARGAPNDIVYAVVCHSDAVNLHDCDLASAIPVQLDSEGYGQGSLPITEEPFGDPPASCAERACAVKVGYPDETLFAEAPL